MPWSGDGQELRSGSESTWMKVCVGMSVLGDNWRYVYKEFYDGQIQLRLGALNFQNGRFSEYGMKM